MLTVNLTIWCLPLLEVTLFFLIFLSSGDIVLGQRQFERQNQNQNQRYPNNPFNPYITTSRYPEVTKGFGSDDEMLKTECRYVKGYVNKTYSRLIRREEPIVFVFSVDRKYFLDAHNTNLRIEADVGNATLRDPVMFSIGQRKYMSAFELPQAFETENMENVPVYTSAAKNLCIQRKNSNIEAQNITVRVSTSSTRYVNFRLRLYLTHDFQLAIGNPLTVDVSPTSPRYFGFQSITPDMRVIKIQASSDSSSCMTLSVQTPYCPVYDKEANVKYQGLWQTMSTQTAMTLTLVNRFEEGFVVVLVAHDSDTKCTKSGYINPYEPPPMSHSNTTRSFGSDFGTNWTPSTRKKTVTLIISNESNVSSGIVFLAMFIPVFTTVLLILTVTVLFRNRHEWMRIEAEQKLTAINCGLLNSVKENPHPRSHRLNIQSSDALVLHDLGILPTPTGDEEDGSVANGTGSGPILSPTLQRTPSSYCRTPTESFYEKNKDGAGGGGRSRFRWKADLTISDFEQKDPFAMRKSGRRFYWTIIIVAIFYCIPVYQLILHYLRVLYRTGEYDICYYNYLCAHRLGFFVDFNHFWSNVSYIIFGFAFIFFVGRRANSMNLVVTAGSSALKKQHKRTHSGTNSIEGDDLDDKVGFLKRCCGYSKIPARDDHGIPHNWGIFYALGIALAMEGVLSAAYHLCPNQSSFQFDTCFMYVISVLIILKIYQFRHSVHFGANHTFLILAAFVLISVIGLMFEFQGSKAKQIYRWLFIAIQFATMFLLALYFYGIGYVRTKDDSKLMTDFGMLANFGQLRRYRINGDRLFLPLISFLMGIAVLIYCELAEIDFATYLLYVLVANVIGSTFYYVGIMKPLHGEFKNRTWVQPVIYFVGAGVIGGFAVKYFVQSPAAWELSAAASRAANEECMKGWFPFYPYYDSHDAWHFLSAAALFLSFMALLIVDDDLLTTPQSKISVF